jgi:hypothetical protein
MATCGTACALDQDCVAGQECVYQRIGIQGVEGVCTPGTTGCNPNEGVVYDGDTNVNHTPSAQCTKLEICSTATDCPAAYPYCAVVGDTSGMCGRAP